MSCFLCEMGMFCTIGSIISAEVRWTPKQYLLKNIYFFYTPSAKLLPIIITTSIGGVLT